MNLTEPKDRFSNLPPAVSAAIREFQRTSDPALVDPILWGIVRKYLPENDPAALAGAPFAPVTLDSFAFESLTLIEVMLDLQDALRIQLSDEESRGLHDMEGARALLVKKVEALRRSPTA